MDEVIGDKVLVIDTYAVYIYDYSSNSSNSTYEGNSNNTSKTSITILFLICYAVPLLFCYLSINIDHKKSLLIYLTILLIGFIPFILINSNWIYLYFIIYFIISIFFTIFLLIKYGEHTLYKTKSNSSSSKKIDLKEVPEEELNKYINRQSDELKNELYNTFLNVQNGWMNFDYDSLKVLCGNELFNTYYVLVIYYSEIPLRFYHLNLIYSCNVFSF